MERCEVSAAAVQAVIDVACMCVLSVASFTQALGYFASLAVLALWCVVCLGLHCDSYLVFIFSPKHQQPPNMNGCRQLQVVYFCTILCDQTAPTEHEKTMYVSVIPKKHVSVLANSGTLHKSTDTREIQTPTPLMCHPSRHAQLPSKAAAQCPCQHISQHKLLLWTTRRGDDGMSS